MDYKVNSVKQILEDGSEVIYAESPKLYWNDSDYTSSSYRYGPGKWYHSKGPYNEAARQYECLLFYVDGLYREKVTFEIEYEMNNAALRYNDCSELYICMYSEETIKHLNSFKGEILVPEENMPRKGNYEAYTFGTNSYNFPFTESNTKNRGYHTFSFELDKSDLKFRPYNQYIEFTLLAYGKDKHSFTKYASINDYSEDNVLDECREELEKYNTMPEKYKKTKTTILLLCSLGAGLIIIYSFNIDKKIKKKYKFFEPTMQMQYFRDIPSNLDPHFATDLVFCKHKAPKDDTNIYSAIMLSLVRKNYIEVTKINETKDWTSNNVKIIIKHKPSTPIELTSEKQDIEATKQKELEPLTPTEEYYFNLIVRHSKENELPLSLFQSKVSLDYENTNSFVKKVDNSTVNIGISQGYFQSADYTKPKKQLNSKASSFKTLGILTLLINFISYQTPLDLAFGAFFILGSAFIIGGIHIKKTANKYILLTQFGEDEYIKWRGLYEFLNSATLISERTVIELPLWEQYLVYATAFGISDKVIAALKVRCPNIDNSPMLSNPYYRSNHFHYSCRAFRTATHTASYAAHSGGYGGHGGYGGGGRGGGGGRRRSLKIRLLKNNKLKKNE